MPYFILFRQTSNLWAIRNLAEQKMNSMKAITRKQSAALARPERLTLSVPNDNTVTASSLALNTNRNLSSGKDPITSEIKSEENIAGSAETTFDSAVKQRGLDEVVGVAFAEINHEVSDERRSAHRGRRTPRSRGLMRRRSRGRERGRLGYHSPGTGNYGFQPHLVGYNPSLKGSKLTWPSKSSPPQRKQIL